MTWPTGPPPMPPPGWYDDPEQPLTWRYWDGAAWSEHRSPQWTPPVRDPRSFSAWFERSFACVKLALRRVGLWLVGMWALASVSTLVAGVVLFTSADGSELRELLGFDDGFGTTTTLTESQADRVADLFGELLVAAIPWIIIVAIVYAVIGAWSWAIVARVAAQHVGARLVVDPRSNDEQVAELHAESVGEIATASLRRVPAVIGSSVVLGLVFLALLVAATVPIVLVVALGGGAAAIVLTVSFVVVGMIAVGVWLGGRLALAPVIAALGGDGIGVRRSWDVTDGQFWYVLGRVIVAALIAGAIGQVVGFATNVAFVFDVIVLLTISLVLQTVVSVISIVIQVSAMVVTLDQSDRADQADRIGLAGAAGGMSGRR